MRGPVTYLLLYAFRMWTGKTSKMFTAKTRKVLLCNCVIHIASDRHVVAAEVVI
jgi:hypothetical protein